jgi:RsiW-degrading membrane proteinase PrsW (M82 family)
VTARPSELTDPPLTERDARGRSGSATLAVIAALVLGLVAVKIGLTVLARLLSSLTMRPETRHELPGPQILGSPRPRPRATGAWWRVLLIGLLLYALGVGVLELTGNPNLFPTVFLLGNFLVPVSYVAFLYERRHLSRLSLPTTALTFLYGGLLGVFAAAVLEPVFIRQLDFGSALVVGLIEEFAKILGVLLVARHRRHSEELEGLILGAAAGMGFAALESTGYAFTTFLSSGGSISLFVGVTLLRGVLSPLGHGTWTAILAGVLFRETCGRRFRLDGAVIGAYLTVSLLHGLWDGLPGLLDSFLVPGADVLAALAVVSATGLALLWWRWREAIRLQMASVGQD